MPLIRSDETVSPRHLLPHGKANASCGYVPLGPSRAPYVDVMDLENFGSVNCPACLLPMVIAGSESSPRLMCAECGLAQLTA